jgi:rhodanese-related sulfurtransferase
MMRLEQSFDDMAMDMRDKTFIDLRDPDDVKRGAAEGAINIPDSEINSRLGEIDRTKPVYLMCYAGATSLERAQKMRDMGFEAYSLTSGYRGYILYQMSL